MKALLIGRHVGVIPDVDIAEQLNVTFPTTAGECVEVLGDFFARAELLGADALIFQAVTAPLAGAMIQWSRTRSVPVRVGGIASQQAPMPTGAQSLTVWCDGGSACVEAITQAVTFANPRATVTVANEEITVTAEQPRDFRFSHIEWLLKPQF